MEKINFRVAAIERTMGRLHRAGKNHLIHTIFSLAGTITSLAIDDENAAAFSFGLIELALNETTDLEPARYIDYCNGDVVQ